MTEPPAVTLRRAAEKARTLAQVTGQSDWTWFTGPILDAGPFDFRSRVNAKRRTERGGEEWTGVADTHEHLADYVAAMSPGVALLIADQWDAIADHMDAEGALAYFAEDGRHAGWSTPSTGKCIPIWTAAFSAARTFLGEN